MRTKARDSRSSLGFKSEKWSECRTAGPKDTLASSIQCIQTRPRQRSKDIDALFYKVNFTRRPREPTPCESEIDEVEVRKVGTFACKYVLRLDVAMYNVAAVDMFQDRQLYDIPQ